MNQKLSLGKGFCGKRFYAILLKAILRLHTLTYCIAGILSQKVEDDGIHPKHRLMGYHRFFVNNIGELDSVLDIGCGNGALTYDVAKKARRVTGIDLEEKNIAKAQQHFSRDNVEFLCGDVTRDLPDDHFDVIILSNVLEHIEDRVGLLVELKRLAPRFLLRVPMENRSWIDLYKKEQGVEHRLDPTHFTEYTFVSFKDELNMAGLEIVESNIQFGEIWAVVVLATGEESEESGKPIENRDH